MIQNVDEKTSTQSNPEALLNNNAAFCTNGDGFTKINQVEYPKIELHAHRHSQHGPYVLHDYLIPIMRSNMSSSKTCYLIQRSAPCDHLGLACFRVIFMLNEKNKIPTSVYLAK